MMSAYLKIFVVLSSSSISKISFLVFFLGLNFNLVFFPAISAISRGAIVGHSGKSSYFKVGILNSTFTISLLAGHQPKLPDRISKSSYNSHLGEVFNKHFCFANFLSILKNKCLPSVLVVDL